MPSVLIYGGSGQVAKHLTKLLTSTTPAWTVYSIVRSSQHDSALKAIGATPVLESIEDATVDSMAATLSKYKPDAIVWAAGAGGKGDPSRTQKVDRDGAIHSFDAAAKAGVKRYVMLSAHDVRDRSKPTPEWYTDEDKAQSDKGWEAIGKYMEAKLAADKELVTGNKKRGLQYTIVRPGTLGTDEGTGKIKTGKVGLVGKIPREDVSAVLFEVLKNDGTIRLAFDVMPGDTSIPKAIEQAAKEKVDTFEGTY